MWSARTSTAPGLIKHYVSGAAPVSSMTCGGAPLPRVSNGRQYETHANAAALPAEYMPPFVIVISLAADAFIRDKLCNAGCAVCISLI